MRKLKIFLADLSHNYRPTSGNYMPYTVGLVASYAKKIYGDLLDIRLFKYPFGFLYYILHTQYGYGEVFGEWRFS
mgnify:CR=1 FL=1